MYISDDGDILGVRYDNWKVVFMEQRCKGTMQVWAEPFARLRLPKFFNLRTDPYEFADVTSNTYYEWLLYHAYILYGAMTIAQKFADTFKDFPTIQKPNTLHDRRRDQDDAKTRPAAAATSARERAASNPAARTCRNDGDIRGRPLPSWNDGAAKSAILDFVARVTKEGGPDFVPPAERIATFDNDGTLWCEQPMQVQVFFVIDRVKELAGEGSVAEGAPAVQGVARARHEDPAWARQAGGRSSSPSRPMPA